MDAILENELIEPIVVGIQVISRVTTTAGHCSLNRRNLCAVPTLRVLAAYFGGPSALALAPSDVQKDSD